MVTHPSTNQAQCKLSLFMLLTMPPLHQSTGSMHADERLQQNICVPSLVLIAKVIFLLECGHTDKDNKYGWH